MPKVIELEETNPVLNPTYRTLSFSSRQVVSLVLRVLGLGLMYVVTINCVRLYGPNLCKAK